MMEFYTTVSRRGSLREYYNHWCGSGEGCFLGVLGECVWAGAGSQGPSTRSVRSIGPLNADALVATIGDAKEFKNGRQLSAWLGLVPTQHSSGGHTRLGGISCRGDAYLRTLLIQGARSSPQRAKAVSVEKATPEQLWIRSLTQRLSFGKLLVAIASKHARQIWVMLARSVDYDPDARYCDPLPRTEAAF